MFAWGSSNQLFFWVYLVYWLMFFCFQLFPYYSSSFYLYTTMWRKLFLKRNIILLFLDDEMLFLLLMFKNILLTYWFYKLSISVQPAYERRSEIALGCEVSEEIVGRPAAVAAGMLVSRHARKKGASTNQVGFTVSRPILMVNGQVGLVKFGISDT